MRDAEEPTPRSRADDTASRLGVVAHELRSPVAALATLASAAPDVPSGERGRLFELVVAAVRDIERILSDPELTSLRKERVDVGRLVTGLATDAVTVAVAGWPQADADPTRLRQALVNLVANGLRHGTRVVIDVGESEGRITFEVTDDGPGVAPGIDPFVRGVSGSGSSGVGLWLARAIAEAHGGSLDLVSGAPEGARFRLALPSASAEG
jgi:signal transduction histidine kinase